MSRLPTLLLANAILLSLPTAQEMARPRVGLVLSGGGARGAAHVGVLQVLEELHVPVDFVVGTSMGSILGGLYAAGYSPEEMAALLGEADWDRILSDAPPREELWFRRRQDDRRFQVDLELGWLHGGLALPPGLIQGLGVEAFLQDLFLGVEGTTDFDELAVPFRCVATDIADGAPVVLGSGPLARAIRASMSLPGLFAPVELDGRVLVDGGVVDNVPVGVARDLGADVVIVVDISSPLADPATLRSLLGVSNQVIGILMSKNRQHSMASLTEEDVAIVPDLEGIRVLDFGRSVDAIELGRQASLEVRDELARLAVDDPSWSAWLAHQRRPPPAPPRVRSASVAGRTGLGDDVILELAGIRAGDVLDRKSLDRARRRLAGLKTFEHVGIDLRPVPGAPGEADVVLRPEEKAWGPHYLRFRLGVESDLRGPASSISASSTRGRRRTRWEASGGPRSRWGPAAGSSRSSSSRWTTGCAGSWRPPWSTSRTTGASGSGATPSRSWASTSSRPGCRSVAPWATGASCAWGTAGSSAA